MFLFFFLSFRYVCYSRRRRRTVGGGFLFKQEGKANLHAKVYSDDKLFFEMALMEGSAGQGRKRDDDHHILLVIFRIVSVPACEIVI